MSTPKAKRQAIPVELKKMIKDAREKHPSKSYADLAKEFSNENIKLTKANVQTILNGKDNLQTALGDGAGANRKRFKKAEHEDLEEALLTWFKQVRSQNVAISGPLLTVSFKAKSANKECFRRKRSS